MAAQGTDRTQILSSLDEIAGAIMTVQVEDGEGLEQLTTQLGELAGMLDAAGANEAAQTTREAGALLRGVLDGTANEATDDLLQAWALTSNVQDAVWADDGLTAAVPAQEDGPEPDAGDETEAPGPTWDDDTIELVREFLPESDEGLAECDAVLLAMEQEGPNRDKIDTLFRAFHTIKGTAGFLQLDEVSKLAHSTENLLSRAREGTLELAGAALDLVFDSVEVMRRQLDVVREALDHCRPVGSQPEAARQVERLDALLRGEAPPAATDLAERPAASSATTPARASESVRIDLQRVDNLVELISELVIAEAMVANAPEVVALGSPRVRNLLTQLGKISRDLQGVGMTMRMVPLRATFQKMARMVRDLARETDKPVRVVTSGDGTELDRSMVERLADPLVHIIRNAVDHGIDDPAERRAAGKPETGVVELSARHERGNVVIEVRDDGRGLSRDKILAKARDKGLIHGDVRAWSDEEVFALIFAAGFSTADKITQISGRGVGMDVVRRSVETLRGRVSIRSTPGAGTTFELVLPVTLAIIDGMLVSCGDEQYILPTLSVVESVQPSPEMLGTVGQRREFLNLRGQVLPLFRLASLLRVPHTRASSSGLVVVVESHGRRIGLLVDQVVTQQQVVIKSLGDGIGPCRFASGAAVLSDGRVGVILDVDELARTAPHSAPAPAHTTAHASASVSL